MSEFKRIGDISTMHVFRPVEYDDEFRTYVVLGCPRGGTTMIAAILDSVGIDMGPMKDGCYDFEDKFITGQIDHDARIQYASERNANSVWGFKDPMLISTPMLAWELLGVLRNPILFIVMRDPVANACALRAADEHNGIPARNINELLFQVGQWQRALIATALAVQYPTAVISYDKARSYPNVFWDEFIDYTGLILDPSEKHIALGRIAPKGGYLQP